MGIVNFLKGIIIGVALVIPGLSGSIFSLIVGLYDKILLSINNIKRDFTNEFVFLSPILLGVLVGILASTKIVLYLCVAYPLFSYSFFIGLVLGSFPFIFVKIEKVKFAFVNFLIFFGSLGSMIFLSAIENSTKNNYILIKEISSFKSFFVVMFSGAFSTSLMAVPGVSGSILLMIINQYGTVYNAVANTSDFIVSLIRGDFKTASENFQSVLVIIPFAVGGAIGIWCISKILIIIIDKYEEYLYVGVLGIMVAAVITLFKQGIIENIIYFGSGVQSVICAIICIAFALVGYFLSKSC